MSVELLKLFVGATATIALYSILWKENKFYRFFEHVYIGLAVGFAVVALWTENLEASFWNTMIGRAAGESTPSEPGMWTIGFVIPLGFLGFLVFTKKYGWMARIPIGIILGMIGGQQFEAFQNDIAPQIRESMRSFLPTTFNSVTVPRGFVLSPERSAAIAQQVGVSEDAVNRIAGDLALSTDREQALLQETGVAREQLQAVQAQVRGLRSSEIYVTQAVNNILYLFTLLSVLCYFLFSFELRGKFLNGVTKSGRLLMMVGFGAIFGSTVMTRFALLIDRMYFVFVETLRDGFGRLFGG